MNADPLPSSSPEAQGVAAAGIEAFLDALEQAPGADPHSLMILRHGQVVFAGAWHPYALDRPHLVYSLSKSFTSTAALFAIYEGLLGLDDTVVSHFPELDAEVKDARSRSIKVRHIASMATGHLEDTWLQALTGDPGEPVRGFLRLPPDREPGSVFAYNQSATYALGAIVQRLTGRTLADYLRQRFFDPIGACEVAWQEYPSGRNIGFSGLFATTDTIARLGQFYLQQGVWRGNPILGPELVADATRRHISTPAATEGPRTPDWEQGYGFQFWMSRHGYRGDGAYGQFCLVLPEQDAVIAMTAGTDDMQSVLDAVWSKLLPGFDANGRSDGSYSQLEDRLANLAVKGFQAAPAPPEGAGAWGGEKFLPVGGICHDQPSLLGVDVAAVDKGWRIALREAESSVSARFGASAWAVTQAGVDGEVPTACTGGWVAPGILRFDVVFLDTPHRLVVTCKLPERTFEARWLGAPLFSERLADLRAPRSGETFRPAYDSS